MWIATPLAAPASSWSAAAFRGAAARIVEVEARLGSHVSVIPQGVCRPDVAVALAEPHADWCGFEGTLALQESDSARSDRLVVRATDEFGETAQVEVPVRILPSRRPVIEIESARGRDRRVGAG